MELNLCGKKAIVTGASKGIGRAIKEVLMDEDVEVYNMSRTNGVDLMTDEGLKFTKDHLKFVDILINNVGGGGTWDFPDWRIVLEKNLGLTIELTNQFLQTKRNWGRVITISSIFGKEKGLNPQFTAAKAAQIAYMKSWAGSFKGITFNTVCPGHINVEKEFPYKPRTIGKPYDVANLIAFLCSDKAKHINGACITVDGGESHSF